MLEHMPVWQGDLQISPQREAKDLNLLASGAHALTRVPLGDHLELLAYVNPSRVPLSLIFGPPLRVHTRDDETEAWFSDVLLHEAPLHKSGARDANEAGEAIPWHESSIEQSRIAILARPTSSSVDTQTLGHRVTEVLFFAARKPPDATTNPYAPRTPSPSHHDHPPFIADDEAAQTSREIELRALLISSDLLDHPLVNPSTLANPTPISADQPKQRLNDLFDTADHLRKRTRHNSARSISIAASCGATASAPASARTFDGRGIKVEDADSQFEPHALEPRRKLVPQRQLSRSSSISHTSRPSSVRGAALAPAFSRTTSNLATDSKTTGNSEGTTIADRNKQIISRTVMAGMRLCGLQPASKSTCAAVDVEAEHEYKGVYHQVYKGALFAFRRDVDEIVLRPEVVRDVVDRLLGIFCGEVL